MQIKIENSAQYAKKKCIDRKIIMMLSFICRMIRNRNEVFALDATRLTIKILEKGLRSNTEANLRGVEVYSLCNKIYNRKDLTIGDAIKLKEALNLTDSEAIEIFLS